jgi:Abnormal spindle-like microcephaly-assoc'd, ASPM-SPD-2-Hydin
MSLVGLLMAATLSACNWPGPDNPSCTSGEEAFNGKCLPHVTVKYLACIDGKGFSVSNEVSVGTTLPDVANSTFTVAYKRSKEEDSTVALQIVHDCLKLAEETATSGTDRDTARQYASKATQYIDVVKQKLPAIELDPPGTLDCGPADVGTQVSCQVTIKSTGLAPLQVTSTEVTGADSGDFTAVAECPGTLEPGQSCQVTVQFQPSVPGERNATLVIHENLPSPDHGTPLQLTGTGTTSPPAGPTLTVTVGTSAAAGGVTSSPSGIEGCRSTCTGTFGDGTDITLTVSYDQGSGQVIWGGCDTISGDSCTVHLTTDRTVTASLSPSP